MTSDIGAWLTAVRLARLPLALRSVRSHPPPGLARERAPRVAWLACGGPYDEVVPILELLVAIGLLEVRDERFRGTRSGRRVATQDHQQGGTHLALALIRAGYFTDQARRLLEFAAVDATTGAVTCKRAEAVQAAPQLVGLIRRFTEVTFGEELVIPAELAHELTEIWAIPPRSADVDDRTAIGDRGELYSYRLEQLSAADPTKVRWVARDDDSLGYDIEDLNHAPRRRIEVKASRGRAPRYFLSANEWDVAHDDPDSYEIHFWGDVDLKRSPREDFARLRRAGFPLVYRNLPALAADESISVVASQFVVTASMADS